METRDTNTRKNLNIVIDGNYFFHKTLPVYFSSDDAVSIPKLTSEEDQGFYARKLIMDFAYMMRNLFFPTLNNVILVFDSRSWRKDIEIHENAGYKSNRVKSSTINWEGFYEVLNKFSDLMQEQHIFVSRVKGAEGDDLLHLYAQKFLSIGEDTIAVTGDKDIWQIVNNKNDNFVSVLVNNSKFSKLILDMPTYQRTLNENATIMDPQGYYNNFINLSKLEDSGFKRNELDPIKHSFEKIFPGDAGDGVPPVVSWSKKQKNGTDRIYRITGAKTKEIWAYMDNKYTGWDRIFNLTSDADFDTIYRLMVKCTFDKKLGMSHIESQNLSKEYIKDQLNRNIKLMVLHDKVIPQDIIDGFEEQYKVLTTKFNYLKYQFKFDAFNYKDLITRGGFGRVDKSADYFESTKKTMKTLDKDDFFNDDEDGVILN